MTKTTNKQIENILDLHSKGMKNREISRELKISHRCVGYYITLNGRRANGAVGCKLEKVDETHARCSRCKTIKSLEDWPIARDNKKYPYRLSYCKECRRKQMYERINRSPKNMMNDRFNKIKLRAIRENIDFGLTKKHLIDLFNHQKGMCFYTGETLSVVLGSGRDRNGLSIDRIDNSIGYVNENIVLCTNRFNTIKSNMTLDEIKKWMPPIYEKIYDWRRRGIFVFNCCQHENEF